jgi:glycosyltransferase involved in cell wall biosynthesis
MAKVTIIIPVYNVEQYLRQCLDSVVNQTLRDIEIICVNDGSPDGSPQILEEYAARDSRITVIHKENGGLSSARNAAYPYIKSKYTLFVDSDDWIDTTLCEKTVTIAEQEQADMTLYFFHRQSGRTHYLEEFLKKYPFSSIDKITLLRHVSAWSKLWRSRFIIDNQLFFPDGLLMEDHVVHWKALLRNPKLAILSQKMYWYRARSQSITEEASKRVLLDVIPIYEMIKEILKQENQYSGEWKNIYLNQKLCLFYSSYFNIAHAQRYMMEQMIRKCYGADEHEFIDKNNNLPWHIKDFYYALDNSTAATIRNIMWLILRYIKQKLRKQINIFRLIFLKSQ